VKREYLPPAHADGAGVPAMARKTAIGVMSEAFYPGDEPGVVLASSAKNKFFFYHSGASNVRRWRMKGRISLAMLFCKTDAVRSHVR